jgi:hypothetical protein
MGNPRMADGTGAGLTRSMVVVPRSRQFVPTVAVQVDEAEAEQGDRPWRIGVVTQQITDTDGWHV